MGLNKFPNVVEPRVKSIISGRNPLLYRTLSGYINRHEGTTKQRQKHTTMNNLDTH